MRQLAEPDDAEVGLVHSQDQRRVRAGGALPLAELPSFACAVEDGLAAPLREGEPPIVGIVREGRLLLDCRTIADDEVDVVADAVRSARA